ncbi:MAG: tetratricopeptide repeat protein, partial [Planctomycetota bacterium]
QRQVTGLDMEASVMGLVAHIQNVSRWIVVKGVMDHAEPDRNYGFRPFAARAAGEVLLGFLRQHLEPGDRKTPEDFLLTNIWDKPKVTNPGTLLNARYEVVEFMKEVREREMADLTAWCEDGEATEVRLFFGPGGAGKTRLFIEYCRQLRDDGWYAGFLSDQATPQEIEALLRADRPTMAVLDYAECRPQLFDLLQRVAARPEDQATRLRIVLLAREVGDWWHSLLERDESVRHLLSTFEPAVITPVPLEGTLRQRVWEHAQQAFAGFLDKSTTDKPVDLDDERYERMLYLHMAALAAVEGLPIRADSVLADIVRHERHFWTRRYKDEFEDDDLDEADFRWKCGRLVGALTLLGGSATREAAEKLNRRVSGPSQEHIVPFLRSLYPGPRDDAESRYLGGLEPDLLGETLVTSVLTDPNNRPEQVYLEHVFESAREAELRTGFVTLGRISVSRATESIPWLTCVLQEDIAKRARPAFQAGLTLGQYSAHSPLGQILARAMEEGGTVDLAAEFESLVPDQTVSLRELAVWATQHLLTWLGKKEESEETLLEQARLLNNLGPRLSDLGRREDALTAAQEAVEIYRRLAKDRPDAFLPDLAMSLNNLGNRLSELGRREDALTAAQEAVEIYRRLAKDRPDAFLPYLATLAKDRPDAFAPNLATSLGALGTCLHGAARLKEAVEAFREGVEVLKPAFLALPGAFTELMGKLVSVYLSGAKELGEMPDMELLGPIVARFEEMKEEE